MPQNHPDRPALNARPINRLAPPRLARTVRGALIVLACYSGGGMIPPDVQAADPATTDAAQKSFNVPAGPLGDALTAFALDAGVSITVEPELVRGLNTSGLTGSFTVEEGLAQLLTGTGLDAVSSGERTYVLQQRPAASGAMTLPAVKVQADAARDVTATEGTGSYTAKAVSIGGKTARDPKEIQQSVSIVTRQRIQEQNLTSTLDAVGQVTGITIAQTNYQSIYSRGFQISSMQFDGGSPALINNYSDYSGLPDMAAYDHIEVLRGADGLFAGSGEAGGTINLVRKRPLDHNQVLFDVSASRWDSYRTQIDATGPLGFDGGLRGRFVAAQENKGYFYDVIEQDKTVLYGVLEADVSNDTLITLGSRFEMIDSGQGFSTGLPRYTTGEDLGLSRSTCLCTDWSYSNTDTREIFAKLEHSFDEDWTLKLNVSRQVRDWEAKYMLPFGAVDPFTLSGLFLFASIVNYSPQQTLADVALNGRFEVLGHEQELTLGFNRQDVDGGGYKQSALDASGFPPLDVFNFDPAAYPEPAVPRYWGSIYSELGQKQSGFYTNLRSEINDTLHSILGFRYSDYEYARTYIDYDSSTGAPISGGGGDLRFDESNVLTPYGGLTYDLTEVVSLYASYSSIFQSQGTLVTASGDTLKPIEGDSYEIGVKGSWLDGALNASVAAYNINRRNEGVQTGVSADPNCCYAESAEIQSRGIDTELTGKLLPGWDVFTGYTYNINEYKEGYGDSDGTAYFPLTPKHLLKLWSMVQLPGAWSDWRLGGGVNAQTKTYVSGTATTYDSSGTPTGAVPFKFTQGSYALVNLRGEYRMNEHWLAALNINNLFDKTYYQTVGSSGAFNFYGEPRNLILSLSGQF